MKPNAKFEMVFHDLGANKYYLCFSIKNNPEWLYSQINAKIAKSMISAGAVHGT